MSSQEKPDLIDTGVSRFIPKKLPVFSFSYQWGARSHIHHRDHISRHRLRGWLLCSLNEEIHSAQLTVRVVDEVEGSRLNRSYRGRDYPTNVLTFPYEAGPNLSADLVLCAPVIEKEASDEGKNLMAHYAHLVVHGVLHAQGYDHENDDEAVLMQTQESQILKRLGFEDPYKT